MCTAMQNQLFELYKTDPHLLQCLMKVTWKFTDFGEWASLFLEEVCNLLDAAISREKFVVFFLVAFANIPGVFVVRGENY